MILIDKSLLVFVTKTLTLSGSNYLRTNIFLIFIYDELTKQ